MNAANGFRLSALGSRRVAVGAALVGLAAAACSGGAAPAAPAPSGSMSAGPATYHVWVANESSDLVSELEYRAGGDITLIHDVPVGVMPADLDGAHGMKVSPDGRYWYVSLAHGTPFGKVWKYTTDTNEYQGEAVLGLFPASMSMTPGGDLLFVVNFNLHGDPVPSTVSIVHTPTMTELARPTTCVMPHGSRINVAGTKNYTVCMHSNQLVEIDTRSFEVSKRISVLPGAEGPLELSDSGDVHMAMDHADHGGTAAAPPANCSPTWATPGEGRRANRYVYVPCNKNGEVLEVDLQTNSISRRFPTGKAPYNLDITSDGRLLVASLKGDQAAAIFDLDQGKEVARVATTQPITHGVAVSPDDRYVFISNESIGNTPSTVDVIDLRTKQRVASVPVHFQAGGIDVVTVR